MAEGTRPHDLNTLARYERETLTVFGPYWSPVTLRILIVGDDRVSFDSTMDFGMARVIEELQSDPWWWVRFEVVTAHRERNTRYSRTAAYEGFDFAAPPEGAQLSTFSQVWLFGDSATRSLRPAEITAIETFMTGAGDRRRAGGVFATGDHADLGAGMCADLPRVNKMRRWRRGGPAGDPPPERGPNRHDTLRPGTTPGFHNTDQFDDSPQTIRPKPYYDPFFYHRFRVRWRPHPVLCGRLGVIDVLPDHMHEGWVVAPPEAAVEANEREWPRRSGSRQLVVPEVIAEAEVLPHTALDSGAVAGARFGVLGAYDGHLAGVGRIVTDATWHHWFNINLRGFDRESEHYDKIRNYFWNVALWLAPPSYQMAMYNTALHGLAFLQPFNELDPSVPAIELGFAAVDALGRRVSQCVVTEWMIPQLDENVRVEFVRKPFPPDPKSLSRGLPLLREFVVGGAMQAVMERVGKPGISGSPIPDDELEKIVTEGRQRGVKALVEDERRSAKDADRLVTLLEKSIGLPVG